MTRDEIASRDGYLGVNGVFRFAPSGTTERRLSIYEVAGSQGAVEINKAAQTFDAGTS